jgi:hypothetical protein
VGKGPSSLSSSSWNEFDSLTSRGIGSRAVAPLVISRLALVLTVAAIVVIDSEAFKKSTAQEEILCRAAQSRQLPVHEEVKVRRTYTTGSIEVGD